MSELKFEILLEGHSPQSDHHSGEDRSPLDKRKSLVKRNKKGHEPYTGPSYLAREQGSVVSLPV